MEKLQKVATAVVVNEQDEVLMIKRVKREVSKSGNTLTLVFPGGKQEGEESAAETAVRETDEETGCKVAPEKIIWEGPHPEFPVYMSYVACKLTEISDSPTDDEDVAEVYWIPRSQLAETVTTKVNPFVQAYLDSLSQNSTDN